MKELLCEKNEIALKIQRLEKNSSGSVSNLDVLDGDLKKKRQRRLALEIQRAYNCPLKSCNKSYGYFFFKFLF